MNLASTSCLGVSAWPSRRAFIAPASGSFAIASSWPGALGKGPLKAAIEMLAPAQLELRKGPARGEVQAYRSEIALRPQAEAPGVVLVGELAAAGIHIELPVLHLVAVVEDLDAEIEVLHRSEKHWVMQRGILQNSSPAKLLNWSIPTSLQEFNPSYVPSDELDTGLLQRILNLPRGCLHAARSRPPRNRR